MVQGMKWFLALVFPLSSALADVQISRTVMEKYETSDEVSVLLYLRGKADLTAAQLLPDRTDRIRWVKDQLLRTADDSQVGLKKLLFDEGLNFQSFYIENVIHVPALPKRVFEKLQNRTELELIGYNARGELKLPELPPVKDATTGITEPLRMIKADRVWQDFNVRGAGIVVAGQDTGYRWSHQSLRQQYRGQAMTGVDHNYNWHDAIHTGPSGRCGYSNTTPCDDTGHGTHTMGTILGKYGDSKQIGVAPEAKWIGCRNMADGVGTVATYLECFEFFLTPYPLGGSASEDGRADLAPHIINNSWSCPTSEGCRGGEFLDAIRALKVAGIATVVAAGNNGPGCGTVSSPPGIYAGDVMTVGAFNRYQSKIAFFSGLGPSGWHQGLAPNLIAPGSNVHSAMNSSDSSYTEKSGTSMASPHVAGALALLWSAVPELVGEVDASFELLQSTARPITGGSSCPGFPGGQVPNAVYGYGMLDIHRAIEQARQ